MEALGVAVAARVPVLLCADGLAGGWPAPVVPALPEGWGAGLGVTRSLVAAFLQVRPALAGAPPAGRQHVAVGVVGGQH